MMVKELIIYEGAMCCATGVCGPEPDRELIEFNETLKRLTSEYDGKLKITRASLVFNSLMFYANPEIAKLVKENGPGILPITALNGGIVARQKYMSYAEIKRYVDSFVSAFLWIVNSYFHKLPSFPFFLEALFEPIAVPWAVDDMGFMC